MTREDAATFLELRLGPTRAEAGVLEGDWELVIDDALSALGVPFGDLKTADVADSDAIGAKALLLYYGYSFLYDRVLDRYDVSGSDPGMSVREGQLVTNLKDRMAAAEKAASGYAVAGPLAVASSGYGRMGVYNADFLATPGGSW